MHFSAGSFSFSLFLFLFFSLGSDNKCRECCFSAIFCCTISMMLVDKDDGTLRNSSASYLSEQTWTHEPLNYSVEF